MIEGIGKLEKTKRIRKGTRTIQDAARELGHALAEECPTPEVLKLSGANMAKAGEALEHVRAALWSLPPELSVSYKVSSLVEEIRQFRHEALAAHEANAEALREAAHQLGTVPDVRSELAEGTTLS
jgi:hypothetical protein